ncbi:helicase RepA family protein [Enterobacter cloacae]|uniref:Putative DNA primase n=1 Tax=Enterobacter cloacae subsp. cloacae (strain ATCC 13047 / DSM 30054 / NBRC 13535 / NCTC 10005 / WDCM 00083 / NCDC 279-56) TaxID=716541 RepID=A0A0H3CJC4_ENTCC|nr:helicase RepA family protein [Enterobacter cloacae]ELO0981364.1 AAA family ATPase [Enterobacter asburiae]ADF61252.1 putative DNA primase [Enterobacter cloacae subsp. cloacae ATCC 13047]KGB12652.1 AAA domain protein [Enterobacter cloacae]OOC92040.1 DNA primase [Enterobacter cloacae]QLA64599.1 AAA family ATPase [Enterobacter cloacae]
MKNAPNLKLLPKEKFTEAVIFAGSEAYAHAKGWEEGLGKQIAEDTTPPVYLGPKQLAELDNLRIVDDGRHAVRIYLAGNIKPIQINHIAEKLAVAGVQDAKLYKGIPDHEPEDWREYLSRLREQVEVSIGEESLRHSLPLSVGSDGYDQEQDYTLKSYLPANSLSSIYGPSGSYKSFLAVSWACHVAAGMKWAGKSVSAGAVMYVVGEGGIGVPRRIKAWEKRHGVKLNNLYLVNRPVFPVRREEMQEMIKAARDVKSRTGQPVRLIVVDTLARCFGGNDENDARDMGAFIEGCDVIKRETGATLLVVHHSGKDDTKGARGSSAFRAALDAEFNVRREGDGGAIILTCTKMKDAEEPKQAAFDLRTVELFTDRDGELISSLVVQDLPREAREPDPELADIKHLTGNHAALWQSIRSRKAKGEPCNVSVIRDDITTLFGENGRKGFKRWLDKLVRENIIFIDDSGDITII